MEHDLKKLLLEVMRDFLLKLFYLYRAVKFINLYKEIYSLKNTKKGKSVIVIGNGPSLDKLPEKFFLNLQDSNLDLFAVNYFYNSIRFANVCPDYYFSTDPSALHEKEFESVRNILNSNLSTQIFTSDYLYEDYKRVFPRHLVYGICDLEIRRKFFRNRDSISPVLPRSYVSMTAYKALAVAVWMGYDNIFIIGMDNTYFTDVRCKQDNSLIEINLHAGNVFTETNLGDKYNNIFSYFYDCTLLFSDLYKFSKYNIFNLDKDSLIDAFRKIDYSLLIDKK